MQSAKKFVKVQLDKTSTHLAYVHNHKPSFPELNLLMQTSFKYYNENFLFPKYSGLHRTRWTMR